MNYKITGYKPEKLFHFFEDISAIPRGSANEKAISDYLVAFAEERNLGCHQRSDHRRFDRCQKIYERRTFYSMDQGIFHSYGHYVCDWIPGCEQL